MPWIPAYAMTGRGGFPRHPKEQLSAQNQGFWIDLSLPQEHEGYPSGTYTGSVQVQVGGKIIKEISLEVTLLPHYLPDEKRLHCLGLFWRYGSLFLRN